MIIYNGKNSLKDFDLYVASKDIPVPQRKQITETVPYMSGLWDFSYLDGVDQYEAVTLKYGFDVIADNKQDLNAQKTTLLAWLHSKGDGKLYDTDISTEHHYSVYQAQASWNEDGLQGLLSVEFLCYPFRLKEYVMEQSWYSVPNAADITKNIDSNYKDSGRGITMSASVSGSVVVEVGGSVISLSTGEHTFVVPAGITSLKLKQGNWGTNIRNTVRLVYREEVL